MIKSTIILGDEATVYYNETGTVPSEQWVMDNSGSVYDIEFNTKGEYDAYCQALSDSNCWDEYHVIKHSETSDENQTDKELWAFLYPVDKMDRDVSDSEIVAAYEREDNNDSGWPVEKLTPAEFACRVNDECFAEQMQWVRFIKV